MTDWPIQIPIPLAAAAAALVVGAHDGEAGGFKASRTENWPFQTRKFAMDPPYATDYAERLVTAFRRVPYTADPCGCAAPISSLKL